MRRVLVLRPEPGATATLGRARQRGLDAIAMPLFHVEPVEWEPPDAGGFDGLLLTSANAVRHGGEGLRALHRLQAYAVGEATARTASEAGFDVASVGDGGVDGLLRAIAPDLRLLHLCGQDRIAPTDAPQAITPLIVYRSRELAASAEIPSDCVALIHSPRAGRRFAALVPNRSRIAIAAISPEAANAVETGWESVDVGDAPTGDALLALAARLCNKRPAG